MNPFAQEGFLGELEPWSLHMFVNKEGRTIRFLRYDPELQMELGFNMMDSNNKEKGDQFMFFMARSTNYRIPANLLKSKYFTKAESGLGIKTTSDIEWLEREDPFVKELWMPMLPNWFNAVKLAKERADNEWSIGKSIYANILEMAAAEMRWERDMEGKDDNDTID